MTQDWLGIAGRRAVVAGAGGLGGASALALAEGGAAVTVLDIAEDRLDSLAAEASAHAGSITGQVADLANAQGCRNAVAAVVERDGPPEIFVHAVGRNNRKPLLDFDDTEFDDIVELNLSSAFWLGQAIGRHMVDSGYGRLVFISSVSGYLAHANHGPYAASKGGVNQLVRVMAREWAPHGVTVNAVAPGYVETDLTRAHLDRDGHRAELEALVPAGRLGVPSEVADTVVFLASDRAAFVNGHVLWVDGGRSCV